MKTFSEYKEIILQIESPIHVSILREAKKDGIIIFYFPGKIIHSKTEFFGAAKSVMNLPDYFGNNWDAFE